VRHQLADREAVFGRPDRRLEQRGELERAVAARERVRQLEARALRKLRDTLPAQRLYPILEP